MKRLILEWLTVLIGFTLINFMIQGLEWRVLLMSVIQWVAVIFLSYVSFFIIEYII